MHGLPRPRNVVGQTGPGAEGTERTEDGAEAVVGEALSEGMILSEGGGGIFVVPERDHHGAPKPRGRLLASGTATAVPSHRSPATFAGAGRRHRERSVRRAPRSAMLTVAIIEQVPPRRWMPARTDCPIRRAYASRRSADRRGGRPGLVSSWGPPSCSRWLVRSGRTRVVWSAVGLERARPVPEGDRSSCRNRMIDLEARLAAHPETMTMYSLCCRAMGSSTHHLESASPRTLPHQPTHPICPSLRGGASGTTPRLRSRPAEVRIPRAFRL